MIVGMYKTLINNIINDPDEPQYRKIALTKPRLMSTVFISQHSTSILMMTGWTSADSTLNSLEHEFSNMMTVNDLRLIKKDLMLAASELIKEIHSWSLIDLH